jgi:hypothetical protein
MIRALRRQFLHTLCRLNCVSIRNCIHACTASTYARSTSNPTASGYSWSGPGLAHDPDSVTSHSCGSLSRSKIFMSFRRSEPTICGVFSLRASSTARAAGSATVSAGATFTYQPDRDKRERSETSQPRAAQPPFSNNPPPTTQVTPLAISMMVFPLPRSSLIPNSTEKFARCSGEIKRNLGLAPMF